VSLVGGAASAITDEKGHFRLENVPVGSAVLQFEGRGNTRSRLSVDLHAGSELHLAVEVDGETAKVDCEKEAPEGTENEGGTVCDQGDPPGNPTEGQQDDGQHDDGQRDDGNHDGEGGSSGGNSGGGGGL
jgi:hypothetical protein